MPPDAVAGGVMDGQVSGAADASTDTSGFATSATTANPADITDTTDTIGARPAADSARRDIAMYSPRGRGQEFVGRRANHTDRGNGLGMALGWFSVGLGLAQLLAPRKLSQAIGVPPQATGMRALGAREMALGVGLLTSRRQAPWLWGRVAADAMDIGMLGAALRKGSPGTRSRVGMATAAVAGIALLDVVGSMQQSRREANNGTAGVKEGTIDVEKSITVNRSQQECYTFWRNFENLPRFMQHLESVTTTSESRSHWKATGPGGSTVEWDAELTVDQPDQLLAWRSVENADIDSAGTVSFERAPGGRGTILRVELQYKPPGGKPAAVLAKLSGRAPEQMIGEELRRFKWLIETGVIPTTVGQPSGPRSVFARLLRKGEPG